MQLLIMAAGMGSRFGGLKQIAPMGPNDEFIIDYSIYDAIKAGFSKVVFIIKEENLEIFKSTIGNRLSEIIKVEYVFQKEDEPFKITLDDDGVYSVSGPMIKKFFDVTDFSRDENVKLFARRLRNLGVDNELRRLGVKHGDTVRILDYEFEFFD